MVSLTDGSFFRSSVRTSCTKLTIFLRNSVATPGTRVSMMPRLEPRFRETDVQMQAAALQRVAEVAVRVRRQNHDRLGHRATMRPISGIVIW